MAGKGFRVISRTRYHDLQLPRHWAAQLKARFDLDCAENAPLVHTVYPVRWKRSVGGSIPVPETTVHWLVHPGLVKSVAHLEASGFIKETEKFIRGNATLRALWVENNESYAAARWSMLSDDDQQMFRERGWSERFREAGIGGIRGWQVALDENNRADSVACANEVYPGPMIKCLHLHLASFLANGDNVAGKLVAERLFGPTQSFI